MIIFNSKRNNFVKILLFFLLIVDFNSQAQGPPGPCECSSGFVLDPSASCDPCDPECLENSCIPDANIPIDIGVIFLLLAGLFYGTYVMAASRIGNLFFK